MLYIILCVLWVTYIFFQSFHCLLYILSSSRTKKNTKGEFLRFTLFSLHYLYHNMIISSFLKWKNWTSLKWKIWSNFIPKFCWGSVFFFKRLKYKIYFRLRFGLLNSINTYLRLSFSVEEISSPKWISIVFVYLESLKLDINKIITLWILLCMM